MRIVFAIRYNVESTLLEVYDSVRLKPPIWYRKLELLRDKRIV